MAKYIFHEEKRNAQEKEAEEISEVPLANSSRAINGGAIFSAVSWSKSLLITVLGSCNILECNSKVFFVQIYFLVVVFVIASTQWDLLTVFAEIGKKWISRQCNSSFLWPFDRCHHREANSDGDSVVPNKKIKFYSLFTNFLKTWRP